MKLFITGISVLFIATFLVTTTPNLVKAQSCNNSATATISGSTNAATVAATNNCNSIAGASGLNHHGSGKAISIEGILPPPSITTGVAGGPNSASTNAGTSSASATAH